MLDPADPAGPPLRAAVSTALDEFVAGQRAVLAAVGDELKPIADAIADLVSGGKRFRPAFAVWSYLACGGAPDRLAAVIGASSSLELLHLGALVHDDILDDSDSRRGMPAAHRRLAEVHRRGGRLGDPEVFGRNAAILLGDLLQLWSAETVLRSGLDPVAAHAALPILELMRTEVTAGQYLDLFAETEPLDLAADATDRLDDALSAASRVVEFKSARYTVVRPCQFGAALAGADQQTVAGLAAFGGPIGRAFQYRDDLLGVFGDPTVTGKPAGDDLREGKRTVLVAHALAAAAPADRRTLIDGLGDPSLGAAEVGRLQQMIIDTGARERVESMIDSLLADGLAALAALPLTDDGTTALRALAEQAARRSF